MKIKDFLSKVKERTSKGSVVTIMAPDINGPLAVFEAPYWSTITEAVLNLEIRSIFIEDHKDIVIQTATGVPVVVNDLEALTEAANSDAVRYIALGADIKGDDDTVAALRVSVGVKTLDLNGHILEAPYNEDSAVAAIIVEEGAALYIFDSADGGCVDSTDRSGSSAALWAQTKGKIYVHGGLYSAGHLDEEDGGGSRTVYAVSGGSVEIYGGFFHNDNWETAGLEGDNLVLDVKEDGESSIYCYGGLYHGQNPAWGDNSGDPASFLASGYKAEDIKGINALIYQVKPII